MLAQAHLAFPISQRRDAWLWRPHCSYPENIVSCRDRLLGLEMLCADPALDLDFVQDRVRPLLPHRGLALMCTSAGRLHTEPLVSLTFGSRNLLRLADWESRQLRTGLFDAPRSR